MDIALHLPSVALPGVKRYKFSGGALLSIQPIIEAHQQPRTMSRQTALLFVDKAGGKFPYKGSWCSVWLHTSYGELIPQSRKARTALCAAFAVYKRPQLAHFLMRWREKKKDGNRIKPDHQTVLSDDGNTMHTSNFLLILSTKGTENSSSVGAVASGSAEWWTYTAACYQCHDVR